MMRHLRTYLAGTLLLCSCSENKPDKLQLYLETENQIYCNDLNNAGWETKLMAIEMTEDITSPQLQTRAGYMLERLNKIDSVAANSIKVINRMKLQLLKQIGANQKLLKKEFKNDDQLHVPVIDLWKIQAENSVTELSPAEIKKLMLLIRKCRDRISNDLATSHNSDGYRQYDFNPPVAGIQSREQLNAYLEKLFANNNTAPDDEYPLKRIIADLTYSRDEQNAMADKKNWVTLFGLLTQAQTKILRARATAFLAIRSCVAGEDYRFNKIMAVISGKDIVKVGSREQYQVFMAALKSDLQPIVNTKTGIITEIKEGVASIEVENLKPGKYLLRGTITILNKSGIPKTLPWEKEIEVVK